MKNRWIFFLIFLVVMLWLPVTGQAAEIGEVRLRHVEGDVQLWSDEAEEWIPAAANMPIAEDDRLWIPEEGWVEIQSRNGSVIRLNEKASLEFLRMDRDTLQFHLSFGHAYVYFSGKGDSMLQIDTPFASARAYEKARFRVDVSRRGRDSFTVRRGQLQIDSRRGSMTINPNETFSIDDDSAGAGPADPPDAWETWNTDKDRYDQPKTPERYNYLPDELQNFRSDFDTYGRWVRTPEYGYVWTPTVMVGAGWAPYRQGRWVWRGGDYVWISTEPWGWVPYHYGRWAFIVSIGWCWVPPERGDVFWGPGFVAWVQTPTAVAWVPLAPRETYYGHGHYGRHSVNVTKVTNVTINRTVVNNYRNVNINNAVTTVDRDAFISGRHKDGHHKGNPFREHGIRAGRPDIKPEKSLYRPVDRDIPETKRPPKELRAFRSRDIREERPLVKERTRAVMKPEDFEKVQKKHRIRETQPDGDDRLKGDDKSRPDRRIMERLQAPKTDQTIEQRRGKGMEEGRKKSGRSGPFDRGPSAAARADEPVKDNYSPVSDRSSTDREKFNRKEKQASSYEGKHAPEVTGSANLSSKNLQDRLDRPKMSRGKKFEEKYSEPPAEAKSSSRLPAPPQGAGNSHDRESPLKTTSGKSSAQPADTAVERQAEEAPKTKTGQGKSKKSQDAQEDQEQKSEPRKLSPPENR